MTKTPQAIYRKSFLTYYPSSLLDEVTEAVNCKVHDSQPELDIIGNSRDQSKATQGAANHKSISEHSVQIRNDWNGIFVIKK